jgi:hypothetical protein
MSTGDSNNPKTLREKAMAARRLAADIDDAMAAKSLLSYAATLEERIKELEATPTLPPAAAIPSGEPPIAHAGAALKPEVPAESEPPSDPDEPKP